MSKTCKIFKISKHICDFIQVMYKSIFNEFNADVSLSLIFNLIVINIFIFFSVIIKQQFDNCNVTFYIIQIYIIDINATINYY